jgi:hypothetical protein
VLPCQLVRLSLRLGLLIIGVSTLSASWNGVGAASPENRVIAAKTGAGQSSMPVLGGHDVNEVFCSPQPLSGTLSYRVSSGKASLRSTIHHLPKDALVGINWANNAVRGYLIGTVRSDKRGDSIPGSERLFRRPESGGYNVVLTWPTNTQPLATIWPCRSPAAATLQCERVIETNLPAAAASVEACLSSQLTIRHLCPAPSSTIFVIWSGRTYELSEGRQPVELPRQYGMGAISEACGSPGSGSPSAE